MEKISDTVDIGIIISGSTDPYYNLALEQLLMENKPPGRKLVMLWRNDRAVIVGRYQNAYEEVDIPFALSSGISVVRRNSGGGAVYHDLGNVNYSFILDRGDDPGQADLYIKRSLDSVLTRLNVSYVFDGRNDITVNGAKVSGSAGYIKDGVLLHHGTMLVSSELDILERVLTRNGKISGSLSAKSSPRRVGNLAELCGITVDDIIGAFRNTFPAEPAATDAYCSECDINELAQNKYRSRPWNYGYQPAYNYCSEKRFSAGTVRVNAQIENGVILSARFSGDFFAEGDIAALERALEGTRTDGELAGSIRALGGDLCFLGISSGDIAGLFDDII